MINKNFIKLVAFLGFSILLILYLLKYMPERFPEFSWDKNNVPSAIASILVLLGTLYGFLTSGNIRAATNQLIIWGGIFLAIIVGYAFRFELDYAAQRVTAVLIPSHNWVNEEGQIVIARSSDGHFYTNAMVNGLNIKFMIDTGASDIALTKKDAQRLKIDVAKLKFTRSYSTANGSSLAAPVKLRQVQIGSKIFANVSGHVGSGELDVSLFGMSVISRFKGFKIDKDLLTLSY